MSIPPLNMFSYAPTQVYSMQHPQQHHHHQHAMYAQQQQEANLLLHQYNQLRAMHAGYSSPKTAPTPYPQQPMDQKQVYITDQLVPQSSPQIPIHPQQIQSSSPNNIIQMSTSDTWLNGSSILGQEVFRPITSLSRTVLDVGQYNNYNNNVNNNTSSLPMSASFDSPKTNRYRRSRQRTQNYRRRQRQHSGSSCYESDSGGFSSDNDEKFEWRPVKSKTVSIFPTYSRKRSTSTGRSDLSAHEHILNDIYQTSYNKNGVFPTINPAASTKTNNTSRPKLIQYIEENIIGKDYIFNGPWGLRRMVYCDYTASGRSLEFIENYIKTHVLPLYGNTHSETSLCAQQSTKFREEARKIIKKSVNANDNDILLFSGTGSTGAVHTLVDSFNLRDETNRRNTVVIISAFEHHSNILPWQECGVEMVRIPTTQHGILDKLILKDRLQHYSKLKKRIICSLNAASNITGIYTDVDTISTLVHSYSGFILWDYATAAPYVKIDMNPSATAYKDAIFISTHKFVGGPGTPGIVIAKKNLFNSKIPKICGGGTVNFVTRTCREYSYDIETREEGGTPDIIGCIRAGLVFQLKDSLNMNYIKTRDDKLVKRFYRRFKKNDRLILLGSQTAARLPIFSFIIYIPGICKYLHHNFVCLLLNDLFGIQVRSGCACAGPYALDLLNVNDVKTDIYCMFMTEDPCLRENDKIVRTMMMKPGFTRLNLAYFASDDEIEYILDAIQFIATDGWKFLPLYTYNPETAEWYHRTGFQLSKSTLGDITYKSGKMQYYGIKRDLSPSRAEKSLQDPFREAKLLAADAVKYALETIDFTSDPPLNVPDKYEDLIWFALPIDIALMMVKQRETGKDAHCDINAIPFIPDDAKARLASLLKPKTVVKGRDTTNNRKKYNTNRSATSLRVRQ